MKPAAFLPRLVAALRRLAALQRSPIDPYLTVAIYYNAARMHARLKDAEDAVRLGLQLKLVGMPTVSEAKIIRQLQLLPLPTEALRRNRCWVFSLVAFHYLRQSGDAVWNDLEFVLGTRKFDDRVQFHAWLKCDGRTYFDLDPTGGYAPIFSSRAA